MQIAKFILALKSTWRNTFLCTFFVFTLFFQGNPYVMWNYITLYKSSATNNVMAFKCQSAEISWAMTVVITSCPDSFQCDVACTICLMIGSFPSQEKTCQDTAVRYFPSVSVGLKCLFFLSWQELKKLGLGSEVDLHVSEVPVEYQTVQSLVPSLWKQYRPLVRREND